jgi:hypothetical protein
MEDLKIEPCTPYLQLDENLKTEIMKRILKLHFITFLFVIAPLFMLGQQPPHPNGGNTPGPGNGPVGGGAAIGSGLSILLAMGAAYGLHRFYQKKK